LQIGMGWFPEQPGGLNRVYYELYRALPEAGAQVVGAIAGSPQAPQASYGKIRAFADSNTTMPQRLWSARRTISAILSEEQPRIAASHFALYCFPALDQLRRLPLVSHFHGPWGDEGRVEGNKSWSAEGKRLIEQITYRRSSRIIVLSKSFGDLLQTRYRIPASRIRIVPGGVDSERFRSSISRAEARRSLGWPDQRPIAFAIRRLVRRMGLEDLIDATAQVVKHHPDFLLQIAGRGPLQGELLDRIERLGLSRNVNLLGYLEDALVPLAFRAATFSVVPTIALEGFGLITLESLAAGTPALVTPVGGLPEAVAPLSPNLVFESTGAEAMAARINQFLAAPHLLPDEAACSDYARDNFDWRIIAAKIKEVYQELV
jgi:glycosyltransferase involved in cell wall biosynthesis